MVVDNKLRRVLGRIDERVVGGPEVDHLGLFGRDVELGAVIVGDEQAGLLFAFAALVSTTMASLALSLGKFYLLLF